MSNKQYSLAPMFHLPPKQRNILLKKLRIYCERSYLNVVRCVAFFFIVLPSSILVNGCTPSAQQNRAADVNTVVLAESSLSVPASLSFVARKQNVWASENLKVNVASFAAGRLALDALIHGNAQFATVAETPLAIGASKNPDVVILCEIMNTRTDTSLIARRDKGISKPQDLRGKTIGVFVGTQAEFFMDKFLSHYGIHRSDVKVVNLQPPDAITAINKGDVDAIVAWQPHAYIATKRLGNTAVVFPNNGIYNGFFCIVAQRSYVKTHPDQVRRFLNGLISAEDYVRVNKQGSETIVANQVGIPVQAVNSFFGQYQFRVMLSQGLVDALTEEGNWAVLNGLVPVQMRVKDYSAIVDPKPLLDIDPKRVTMRGH